MRFKQAEPRILRIANQRFRNVDGLIQARTAKLKFNEVFTADAAGDWHGFVTVVFDAPIDPFTAFDYVELSLDEGFSAQAPGVRVIVAASRPRKRATRSVNPWPIWKPAIPNP